MCYNVIILNTAKDKEYDIGELLLYIFESFKYNHDGAFIYNSTNRQYVRTLDYDKFKKILLRQTLSNGYVHMHLRLASSGAVNESNIHGWAINDYLCSHNGSYYSGSRISTPLSTLTQNNNADSLEFFTKFKNEINQGKLSKIDLTGFYGVAYCTPKGNDSKMLLISKNKSIKVYKYHELLIFSNESLDFIYSPLEFAGFKFDNIIKTELLNEILLYDFKKLRIVKRKSINTLKPTYYYPFYGISNNVSNNKEMNDNIDIGDTDNYHYNCKEVNGELECRWEFDSSD